MNKGIVMKKRNTTIFLSLILCICTLTVYAEDKRKDHIHDSLPEVTISVNDTGGFDMEQERPYLLQVSVESKDGSISQKLTYRSSESPEYDGAAAMVRLKDMNFDGYNDLLLLTAQGARNVFYAVSIFHPDENRFMPVLETYAWSTERKAFDTEKLVQLELCNEELIPRRRSVCSSVADGYRYLTEIVYMWEGAYSLEPVSIVDVYDAGEGMIGELLEQRGTGVRRCWDEQYPEEWYYGQDGVANERRTSYRALTVGHADVDPEYMEVADVSWVNLRRQDSKSSPSLAKLNAGTEVQVLAKDCGEDQGWIRVFVSPDAGETGLTGYIWHSYLKPVGHAAEFQER